MSLQRSYFSNDFHQHSFQSSLLRILNDRMDLQINAPENNSCIAVINSMTENYPLAAIDCSLTSDSITFLCEHRFPEVKQFWNEMQLNLIKQRAVICPPKWKAFAIYCVNILSYNKGLTVSSAPDDLRWGITKISKSIFLFIHKIVFRIFQGGGSRMVGVAYKIFKHQKPMKIMR